jgi:hypothetical protein
MPWSDGHLARVCVVAGFRPAGMGQSPVTTWVVIPDF